MLAGPYRVAARISCLARRRVRRESIEDGISGTLQDPLYLIKTANAHALMQPPPAAIGPHEPDRVMPDAPRLLTPLVQPLPVGARRRFCHRLGPATAA